VALYRRFSVDTLTRIHAVRTSYSRNGIKIEVSVLWPEHRATQAAAREQIDSLAASLAALRAAGGIAGYRVAYVDTVSVSVGHSPVEGYTAAIPIKLRTGDIAVAVAFVYVVAGRYVIVRAAVPARKLDQADIPGFARRFIMRYVEANSS
jgi:hypothetical protein